MISVDIEAIGHDSSTITRRFVFLTELIIESKSIDEYLEQLLEMGENPKEYTGVFGYSIGQTEPRMAMYEYPEYDYKVTKEFTNLKI